MTAGRDGAGARPGPPEGLDELAQAQWLLGRAMVRARAGEDRGLAQAVRAHGEQLAHGLHALLRLARVHAPDNHAFDEPVAAFVRTVGALHRLLGAIHLATVEDQGFVNDVRIRGDARSGVRDLSAELGRHGVGGLTFHAALSGEHVRALAAGLSARAAPAGPRRALQLALRAAGVVSVELAGRYRFRTAAEEGGPGEVRRDAAAILPRLVALLGETFGNLGAGHLLNPLPLRRLASDVLDAGPQSPGFWPPYAGAPPAVAHAIEVTVVSLLLGRAAGLSQAMLQDAGVAALVHDAGHLDPAHGAGAPLARHAFLGARMVLRQRGFSEAKVRRLRAVLEHHRDYAGPDGRPVASAIGAILRVAEDYATGARLHAARATRAEVLGAMLRSAGTAYHPALPQLLANVLGLHPPGTLLELSDGTMSRVAVPCRGPDLFEHPVVRRLDPATGLPGGPLLDLAAPGPSVRRALPG